MKPTWLEEPQRGDNTRRLSASLFTAEYTIEQTLHGLSRSGSARTARSRRLTIDIPPDAICLDAVSSPGLSESTYRLDSPVTKHVGTDTEPMGLLSGPTLPLSGNFQNKKPAGWWNRRWSALVTFGKFVGPGFVIAVAYSTSLHKP